jgi:alpha-galactosidase/6-phospho-beta-glucosidase family protein
MRPLIKNVEEFQGEAIRYVHQSYPLLTRKMEEIAKEGALINTESFSIELAWEHTQLLDILVSQQDNLGQTFFVNIPNRGSVSNLPEGVVLEAPATVDAVGLHPFALGDLPKAVVPTLVHKVASLDLIIEAAMEGSHHKAVHAFINDPHCSDIQAGERLVNVLIDAEIAYLPRFK